MMYWKWFHLKNLLVFLLLFGLTTGTVYADDRPDLVVAVTKNPVRIDPMGENSNVNARVGYSILESLIGIDFKNNDQLIPGLATSWERLDSQTLELKLRQGVKCHNGEDFDAEDAAFSFGPKRFLGDDAPGGPIGKGFLGDIQSVEAIDKYTVRIKTGQPDPLLEQRFAGSTGACICKDAFEAAGSWEEWNKAPVGTGPYKMAEYRHGEYIKLEAFADYWGEKAPAKTVTFQVVPEMSARIAGLITGEYHIITEIMPDQFETIEKNPATKVVGGPINNIRVIFYDEIANPVLADPKIRQALNYAIDRQLLVDTIFDGRTAVPKGLQMPSFGDLYIKDFKNITYDPDRARELLKEAGYKGQEISYRYLQDYYTGEVATAQILVDMWRQVGLNVKLDLKENWEQIETEKAAKGRGIINWSTTAVYPDPLSQLYRIYGPAGWFQRYNMYKNDEFNKWGEQLSGIDPQKRREAMEHMLQIFEYGDPPGTYLHYLPQFYGVRTNVVWEPVGRSCMDLAVRNLSFK